MNVLKAIGIVVVMLLSSSVLYAQQFWSEDFEVAASNCNTVWRADTANLGTVVDSILVVDTGASNVSFQNYWFVSSRMAFTGQGNCGDGCLNTAGLTNRTLHISTQFPGTVDPAAVYAPAVASEMIVMTYPISFVGQSDVLLEFDYLAAGNDSDYLEVGFAVGANPTFQFLNRLQPTDTGNCGVTGTWSRHSVFLPAATNGLSDVRIAFRWVNNGDNIGTTLSSAVDNLTLSQSPPLVDFGFSFDTICATGCINLFDSTTGTPTAWSWDFDDGTPLTSNIQNPTNICFNTAGTKVIELTATNSNGSSTVQLPLEVLSCTAPTPQFSVTYPNGGITTGINPNPIPDSICETNCLTFNNESLDGTFGQGQWLWVFQGGTPNTFNGQNPPPICYANNGPYDVELTVTDTAAQSGLSSSATFADVILVANCSPPTANFTEDTTEICENDVILFEAQTIGNPDSFRWEFQGGNPSIFEGTGPSFATPPPVMYPTPGLFDVRLTVCNAAGCDTLDKLNYIRVNNCPVPVVNFTVNERNICRGVAVVFEDLSLYATSWFWEFPGGIPATSTDQNPQNILYEIPGIYPVILTVSNINGDTTGVAESFITVDSCNNPVARFEVERDSICRGSCVRFFNTSTEADSIFWVFNKVIPGDSIDSMLVRIYGIDTNNVDTLVINFDSLLLEADTAISEIIFVTDTIFNLNDPILCFDDSLVIGLRLFTFNEYGVDVANFFDFPVLNVGGEYPRADAGPDKIVRIDNIDSRFFLEDTVQLEGQGDGPIFSWFPREGLSCYDCATPVIYPTDTRKYYLTNFDDYGCEAYDSVTVFVEEAYFAGIPNIFSPNGDNNNDFLWVRGNGISSSGFVMRVWDRYGKMVFESYSQNDGWDGNVKGGPAPQGVYMYEVRLKFLDDRIEKLSGNVTLVRY